MLSILSQYILYLITAGHVSTRQEAAFGRWSLEIKSWVEKRRNSINSAKSPFPMCVWISVINGVIQWSALTYNDAPRNCFTSVATPWLLQFYDGGEIGCSAIMDARTGKKWIAKMTLTLKYQDDFDPNTDPLLLPPLKCSWGQRPLPLSLCCNLSLQSWAIKVLKALRFLTPMITISFPLLLHPCPIISWPN